MTSSRSNSVCRWVSMLVGAVGGEAGATHVVGREVVYVILVLVIGPVVHDKLLDGIGPQERCYGHPVDQNHVVSEQRR